MSNRIIYAIVVVVLLIGGYYWWSHHDVLGSGDVTSKDGRSMDSGAVDLDGKPMPDNLSSTANTAADTGAASTKSNSTYGATAATASTGTTITTTAPAPVVQPAPVVTTPVATPVTLSQPTNTGTGSSADLPSGDTLSANAPAGMAFGGSGKFQWYRQGNLTWRINTQSGSSCVAFATMDEWQKPIVYQHGCGNA